MYIYVYIYIYTHTHVYTYIHIANDHVLVPQSCVRHSGAPGARLTVVLFQVGNQQLELVQILDEKVTLLLQTLQPVFVCVYLYARNVTYIQPLHMLGPFLVRTCISPCAHVCFCMHVYVVATTITPQHTECARNESRAYLARFESLSLSAYPHEHTHTYIDTDTHTSTRTHAWIRIHTDTHTHTHSNTHTRSQAHARIHGYDSDRDCLRHTQPCIEIHTSTELPACITMLRHVHTQVARILHIQSHRCM
jgi:hypothetical protein